MVLTAIHHVIHMSYTTVHCTVTVLQFNTTACFVRCQLVGVKLAPARRGEQRSSVCTVHRLLKYLATALPSYLSSAHLILSSTSTVPPSLFPLGPEDRRRQDDWRFIPPWACYVQRQWNQRYTFYITRRWAVSRIVCVWRQNTHLCCKQNIAKYFIFIDFCFLIWPLLNIYQLSFTYLHILPRFYIFSNVLFT